MLWSHGLGLLRTLICPTAAAILLCVCTERYTDRTEKYALNPAVCTEQHMKLGAFCAAPPGWQKTRMICKPSNRAQRGMPPQFHLQYSFTWISHHG